MLQMLPELTLSDFPHTDVVFPRMARVRQSLTLTRVDCIEEEVHAQFARIADRIESGDKVCLAVGSRGIGCLSRVVRQIADEVKAVGAYPFITPAMGSHGGATPEGQVDTLAQIGVTETVTGTPIVSSLDVKPVGTMGNGTMVFVSCDALAADAVIVINRVKPHTAFRGEVESGLCKMMCIGLGKQKGAESLHSLGFSSFDKAIREAAKIITSRVPIVGGVGIVENSRGEAAAIEVVPAEEIDETEPKLLRKAQTLLARIPFDEFDVLAVQQIGKDISGDGMDPNVTGRFASGACSIPLPRFQRLAAMSLTPHTKGNGTGIGMADVVTHRVASGIDLRKTYINAYTSKVLAVCRIPMIMKTERDALGACLLTCNQVDAGQHRVVWILDTSHLEEFWISEPLMKCAAGREQLETVSDLIPLEFDREGRSKLVF